MQTTETQGWVSEALRRLLCESHLDGFAELLSFFSFLPFLSFPSFFFLSFLSDV